MKEGENEGKVVEAEKVAKSSDTSPITQVKSTATERIASLDPTKDTLAFFQKIGKIDFNLLKKSRDSILQRAAEGVTSKKQAAFVLLDYLLRSSSQITPILLENADDWAKALLSKEKYIEWESHFPKQENHYIFRQYEIMLDLMQEEGWHKAEIISQLQRELKIIALSGTRD